MERELRRAVDLDPVANYQELRGILRKFEGVEGLGVPASPELMALKRQVGGVVRKEEEAFFFVIGGWGGGGGVAACLPPAYALLGPSGHPRSVRLASSDEWNGSLAAAGGV